MTNLAKQIRLGELQPLQPDYEQNAALTLQRQWLATVKKSIRLLGWNHPIHWTTRVSFQDVRDTPRYNWHRWMNQQIEEQKG
jgi:hypothetical protein